MSLKTAEALIRKTLQLGMRQNNFCWQGGEPTLVGVDFFREVVEMQKHYGLPEQIIGNSLQTNGLLIDGTWTDFLARHHFLVGLSLDGPADVHDHYRKTPSGRTTFDRVMNTAQLLKNHRVDFNILTLLTDRNIAQPERLYRFFRQNGFTHLQFIPCHEADPLSGELLPFSISAEDLGEFYCRLFDLWMSDGVSEVSIRAFEDILLYYIDGIHTSCTCLKECSSYLVVEHNGDLYPCDFFVYPEWKLGNIVQDSYQTVAGSPLLLQFMSQKAALAAECGLCRWISYCHGDCPRLRMGEQTGTGSRRSPSFFCKTRKRLLTHMEPHFEKIKAVALEFRRRTQEKLRSPRQGRNQPCPCGSGRKYKKCCGI